MSAKPPSNTPVTVATVACSWSGGTRKSAVHSPKVCAGRRHRREAHGGEVVLDRQRRFEDAVAELVPLVGHPDEDLAQLAAVAQLEGAHAADLIGR